MFGAGTAVYAERSDGKILLLLRAAGGSYEGQWFLPGGTVDEGELPERAAVRELEEEAGLVPTSPMTLIGLYELPGFPVPALMVSYACTVDDRDVVISREHLDFRWSEPERMRDALSGTTGFLGDIHADVERYLAWRSRR